MEYTIEDKQRLNNWIYRYSIHRNGKNVENDIIGWKTALAHARKYRKCLFDWDNQVIKVEILNLWTGEIITLDEAERRSAQFLKRRAIGATT